MMEIEGSVISYQLPITNYQLPITNHQFETKINMKPEPKISLKQKGESAEIPIKNLVATLSWTAAVDLDLYAYYRIKSASQPRHRFLSTKNIKPGKENKIYFASRGNLKQFPWMSLDQDAEMTDIGGQHEENLRIADLSELDHILIAINIFNKPHAHFAQYDGRVVLKTLHGDDIEVPLMADQGGSWCVVARIDNTHPGGAKLINVNQVQLYEPMINEFV